MRMRTILINNKRENLNIFCIESQEIKVKELILM